MAQLGLVTVLFTDLVDSTALLSRLGAEAGDQFRREHFQSLRDALLAHRGQEVKNLGDGLMITFGRPSDGAACAVELHRHTARLARRYRREDIAIRIGLSVGEATFEDDDWFGTPVIEAARLCAKAAPTEILATQVVRALVGDRSSLQFSDRGEMELKGLPDPVAVVAISAEANIASSDLPAPLVSAGTGFFVGRNVEADRLRSARKRSLDGKRQAVLVAGEPGIGKTRLAKELAVEALGEGATILYGRCDEEFGLPYQPFVEAFDRYIATCPRHVLDRHVTVWGGELGRIVTEFGRRVPDAPDPVKAEPEVERYRLFEAVGDLLKATDEGAGTVLILDDLHWADNGTLLLLRHLLRSGESMPLLVIGTYRDTDLGRGHPLGEMLADLRRTEDVERVALSGLDAPELEAFLNATAGHALGAEGLVLAEALHEETDGNPFFVGQVVRHLAESGAVFQRDGRWTFKGDVSQLGIPEGVREVIGRRLNRLSDRTNAVLRAAAVVGRQFDVAVVAHVTQLSDDDVIDALDEAVLSRVIVEVASSVDRFSFTHALVRDALYDELSTSRRVRSHKRVGEFLERRADAPLAALAHHFCEAAVMGEVDKAVEYALRAGEAAATSLADEDAAAHFARGLEVLDAAAIEDTPARADLLIGYSESQNRVGELDAARSAALQASAVARRLEDAERLGRAALAYLVGVPVIIVDDVGQELVEEAIDRLEGHDSALLSRLLSVLSSGLTVAWARDPGRRDELTERALAMARRVGDDAAIVWALAMRYEVLRSPRRSDERLALAAEMANHEGGEYLGTSQVYLRQELWEQGDMAGMRQAHEALVAVHDQLRYPAFLTFIRIWDTGLMLFEGRYAEAEASLMAWFQDHGGVTDDLAFQAFGAQFFDLRVGQGRAAEVLPATRAIAEQHPEILVWTIGLGFLLAELDELDEAGEIFERLALDDFNEIADYGAFQQICLALLALTCAYLHDSQRAAVLYDMLLPFAGRNIVTNPSIASVGAASRFLGLLASTMERWDDAREHFEEALAMNERMGARPWVAYTAYEFAAMLSAAGQTPKRRDELLVLARSIAEDIGMAGLLRRVEALGG